MPKEYPTLTHARTWHNGQGLFHPNCRHSVSIYIEGFTKVPPPRTKAEIEREQEAYKKSQQINYDNRMIQAWKNRVATSITPAEALKSKATLKAWYAKRTADMAGKITPMAIIKPKVVPIVPVKTKPVTFKKALGDFENSTRNDKIETAGLFDYKGNLLFDKRGSKNQVSFTSDEVKMMKGNLLTHNHPSGSSFSPEDINMLVKAELKEIRAVGSDRSYTLSFKEGTPRKYLDLDIIRKAYEKNKNDLMPKYRAKVIDGMPEQDAWHAHSHELITNLLQEFDFLEYKRTIDK
jgi:NAD+--asparagine ADP-ribosyltransferase